MGVCVLAGFVFLIWALAYVLEEEFLPEIRRIADALEGKESADSEDPD